MRGVLLPPVSGSGEGSGAGAGSGLESGSKLCNNDVG